MSGDPEPPLHRKLTWFVSLWIGGVAAVAVVAGMLRMWIG